MNFVNHVMLSCVIHKHLNSDFTWTLLIFSESSQYLQTKEKSWRSEHSERQSWAAHCEGGEALQALYLVLLDKGMPSVFAPLQY